MDFDDTRLYYSHQQLQTRNDVNDDTVPTDDNDTTTSLNTDAIQRHFQEFLRNYRWGSRFVYRERLLRMHRRWQQQDSMNNNNNNNAACVTLDLSHLGEYDASLLGFLLEQPAQVLPAMEQAASKALSSLLFHQQQQHEEPRMVDADIVHENNNNITTHTTSIQLLLQGNLQPTPLRSIKSEHMHRLLLCQGIIISSSQVQNRAVHVSLRCTRCGETRALPADPAPFSALALPARCGTEDCPPFPFVVAPDQSLFVDQQTLKLQEAPDQVPTGEMPRSSLMAVERALVDTAPPGTRVSVWCIPTLLNSFSSSSAQKSVYLRVVGMQHQTAVTTQQRTSLLTHNAPRLREEEAFHQLSQRPDLYDILSRSMAPNISGSYTVDIKKALLCQLLGGSRKHLPDGVKLRGDINVLLLGDPSMAKSQFLKFVARCAPIGIYTSGKGSSAAGLTASVVKDRRGEFYLEGGAMVLADGGIVCIDEFDKMRPQDRVAIHEAMEQQTISVAKAGITTVLNSRASVLAAANPVFGRYDEFKSASENIDLMTTILSRFDLIFLVRDIREEERDRAICRHVMGVHMTNGSSSSEARPSAVEGPTCEDPSVIADNILRVATTGEGELDVNSLKKYIQYCKTKCRPRLGAEAGDVLTSAYVKIRDNVRKHSIQASGVAGEDTQATIPITVRQLEALVRISESLAKMRLDDQVRAQDVTEALRLFQVSTMAANAADQHADRTFSALTAPNRAEMERTEVFLRSRLTVGSMVNKQRLVEEAAGQGFNAVLVARALSVMASRGDLLERNQGRLIKRVK